MAMGGREKKKSGRWGIRGPGTLSSNCPRDTDLGGIHILMMQFGASKQRKLPGGMQCDKRGNTRNGNMLVPTVRLWESREEKNSCGWRWPSKNPRKEAEGW